MSLLSLINRFAAEVNIDSNVTTVMGTTDPQIIQMKSLLQKEVNDLAGRGDWESLVNEATFTTGVAGTNNVYQFEYLVDTTKDFQSEGVAIGDTVTNTATGATTTVRLVDVGLTGYLALDDEIFPSTGVGYSIPTEDLGAIADIASNGFRYIRNDTIWDRDLILPVLVIDASDWQQAKAVPLTGPRYSARIRGGRLLSNPVPDVGHTWAFEYVTWNAITDSTGETQKQYFTNDNDLILLPELLLEAGLEWRWKKQKGMEYAEDFRTYEMLVANELSRNGLKRPLKLHQGREGAAPNIHVSRGSWPL